MRNEDCRPAYMQRGPLKNGGIDMTDVGFCESCLHATRPGDEEPCNNCTDEHSNWKPYEIENLWIGDYSPYKCRICGHYSDIKTPYCAYCGVKDYVRN